MGNLKDEKEFVEGVNYARKAKQLRDEAESYEKKAKKHLRELREERYKSLKDLYERQEKEQKKIMAERKKLFEDANKEVCEKLGHVYMVEKEIIGPKVSSSFLGITYELTGTRKCVICGNREHYSTTGRTTFYKQTTPIPEEHKKMLKKAREEIDKKIPLLDLRETKSSLEELCKLFGHDVSDQAFFRCNCCGQSLGYKKYVDDFWAAPYKGIVPYMYEEDPTIL